MSLAEDCQHGVEEWVYCPVCDDEELARVRAREEDDPGEDRRAKMRRLLGSLGEDE